MAALFRGVIPDAPAGAIQYFDVTARRVATRSAFRHQARSRIRSGERSGMTGLWRRGPLLRGGLIPGRHTGRAGRRDPVSRCHGAIGRYWHSVRQPSEIPDQLCRPVRNDGLVGNNRGTRADTL